MNVKSEDVAHQGIRNISHPEDVAVAQDLGIKRAKLAGSIEETASESLLRLLQPSFLKLTHCKFNGVHSQKAECCSFVESIGYRRVYTTDQGLDRNQQQRGRSDIVPYRSSFEWRQHWKLKRISSWPCFKPARVVKANYYFSILAPDSKGQVLKLAELFNAEDISFKQILQDGKQEKA